MQSDRKQLVHTMRILGSCFAIAQTLLVLTCFFFCCASTAYAGTFEAESNRDIKVIRSQLKAAQFLSKATFGPTQADIDSLATRIRQIGYRRACSEWIDDQFDLPASSHEELAKEMVIADGRTLTQDSIGISLYRYQAWWHIALTGEDQLRQKVAWALSQIFVISDSGVGFNNQGDRDIGGGERSLPDWLGMSNYYDMLSNHADGNYRDLLGDITFHECMGVYLSAYRNRKADVSKGRWPDENYAREIMQLFSVGLYELHNDGRLKTTEDGELIPTYTNDGITELARLFTGLRSNHNTRTNSLYTGRNFGEPMQVYAAEHDNNLNYEADPLDESRPNPDSPQTKVLFGKTLPPLPTPLTDAAALKEINDGLDVIAEHDNVPPFISRLLIQRLVKSNPSRGYIRRVTRKFRDNGQGVRGDMREVIKAILLDPEAIRGQRALRKREPLRVEVVMRGTEHSRLREPIQRVTSWIRAMRPTSNYPNSEGDAVPRTNTPAGQPYMMLTHSIGYDIGQMPYRSPSVFNYYLPDYQPPGDLIGFTPTSRIPREALFAPEFQVLTAVTSNKTINRFVSFARNRYSQYNMRVGSCRITFDLDEEIELAKDNANLPEILRRFDLLLCNGSLSEETKASIIQAITSESSSESQATIRLEEALLAVILSADCAIEE